MTNEKTYRKVTCPHCGNVAPMDLRQTYSEVQSYEEDQGPHYEAGDVYEILKCPACNDIVFRKYFWNDGYMEDCDYDVQYEMLFPLSKKIPLGLPPNILKEYEAANKVRKVSSNAFGVLIRRVLEMVCVDRKATGDSLYKQLKHLSSNGEIPSKLVDVATHIKDLGNVGAHATLGNLTDAEVSILDDLCRAILEYVYSAPHLAQKAQNSLQALKK
jgi:hypothetical protein